MQSSKHFEESLVHYYDAIYTLNLAENDPRGERTKHASLIATQSLKSSSNLIITICLVHSNEGD